MNRIYFYLLSLLFLAACQPVTRQTETAGKNTINWVADATLRYQNDSLVNQLVLVQGIGGRDAIVKMLEKTYVDGKSVWTITLVCDAVLGKNGLGKEREGDMKTPIGDFGVLQAFGIKHNPGTTLPYVDVDEYTWCCGDSVAYNRIIDIRQLPHSCDNGEHMLDYTPHYNYGLFIDYNCDCVLGRGSGIFFHCFGPKPYTAGCVAVSEENMARILCAIDAHARVIIDYME